MRWLRDLAALCDERMDYMERTGAWVCGIMIVLTLGAWWGR